MAHTRPGVERQLVDAIEACGRGREHLRDPVWRKLDEGARWRLGHALAPKACEVRHHDVLAEMKLGFV